MTALEPIRSPCRSHPCSVEHADVVWSYRDLVRSWEERADEVSNGHATELEHFEADHPRPSFKDYLKCRRTR